MNYITAQRDGSINLQATLSAASAMPPADGHPTPHHPITCPGDLSYNDDGTFACDHAHVPAGDVRTQYCVDHSIALLLIELSKAL
ncbi:MAG: hypothetical protein ACRDY7_05145 [Acidimicrobiia bacterium]